MLQEAWYLLILVVVVLEMGRKWNSQGWYKGKGRNYRGGGGGRGGRGTSSQNAYQDVYEETNEKRLASNTDKHLSKADIRSYIGQAGMFRFMSGAQDEEEFCLPRLPLHELV